MTPSRLICRCELPAQSEAKGSEAFSSPFCGNYRRTAFHLKRPKGQTLVEFAILLPVLLLISIVVIDLGRAIYYYSAIHNAAREGVRYGIIYPEDPVGMRSTTIEYAFGLGLKVGEVTAGPGSPQCISCFPNSTVKVSVEYAFTPATPLVSNLLPGGKITLKSEAVMRTETYFDQDLDPCFCPCACP